VLEKHLQQERAEVANNHAIGELLNAGTRGARKKSHVMASMAKAFGRQRTDIEQCGRIAARHPESEIQEHLAAGGNWAELAEVDRLGDLRFPDGTLAAKAVLEEARANGWGPLELRKRVSAAKDELGRGGPPAAGEPPADPFMVPDEWAHEEFPPA
jgi:hypothetical protein